MGPTDGKQGDTVKRKIAALLLLLALLFCASVPAAAEVDYDYEGELDINGNPIREGDEGADGVTVGNGRFDRRNGVYRYAVDGSEIRINYPDGVVTTSHVSMSVPTGMKIRLYRDGAELASPDLKNIGETGSYVAVIGNDESLRLTFTILSSPTCRISSYRLPEGFRMTKMTLDGEDVPFESGFADMSGDGRYEVRYECPAAGVSYSLNVLTDHTAPELRLDGVNEKGYAQGAVTLSGMEEGATVRVYLDGKEIPFTTELTTSGSYRVLLRDEAGNETDYRFTIRVYFDFNSAACIGLVLCVIAALIVYLVYSRKKLRVR